MCKLSYQLTSNFKFVLKLKLNQSSRNKCFLEKTHTLRKMLTSAGADSFTIRRDATDKRTNDEKNETGNFFSNFQTYFSRMKGLL